MFGKRGAVVGAIVAGVVILGAGTAGAHQCTNVSKPTLAGAQVILDAEGNIASATKGVLNRVERGIIDADSGEGYHGLVAFDSDGDGIADVMTYIVGPNAEIPLQAQQNGSPDHGIVNLCGGVCE